MTVKICCVCKKNNSNYKCPKCREPYCSTCCWKVHKEQNCEATINLTIDHNQTAQSQQQREYDFPTEDTVPLEKLRLLNDSQDVKECLKNHHVRDIITAILKDNDPTRAIGLAMTEPIFVELADACLRLVETPHAEDKPS